MGLSTSAPTMAPMAPPTNSRIVNFAREFPGMRTSLRWSSILSPFSDGATARSSRAVVRERYYGLHRAAAENKVPESERRGSGWMVGNSYLGITSGLPVTREQHTDSRQRSFRVAHHV